MSEITPASFATLGALIRYLRERAHLSQRELAAIVDYHYSYISRLEKDQYTLPHVVLMARFVPALNVQNEPQWIQRLVALAGRVQPARKTESTLAEKKTYRLSSIPSPMIGRGQESTLIADLLLQPHVRLLTIIGPPGVGKTHVALHVAEKNSEYFSDGVLFVNLVPIEKSENVLHALAASLDLLETSTTPSLRMLQSFLQNRNMLIVMDNFEQVLGAGPQLNELLGAAPEIKILVTSREALRIQGEREFPILPLPIPSRSQFGQLDILDDFPAIQLFTQRAIAVQPQFQLTDKNAALVAEICFRLDGLPLAIELAASRIQTLSLVEMLAQFDRLFDWLTRGRRDTPLWRQTLFGAIEWSYELLTGAERLLLARLAVFSGSWTLESAEAVCSDDELLKRNQILDVLSQLVDRSLIVVDFGQDTTRYRFLDTIFHFAVTKLKQAEQWNRLHDRHMEYFSNWAENHIVLIEHESPLHLRSMMDMDGNNIRSALEWGLNGDQITDQALILVGAVGLIWLKQSHFKEALEWVLLYLPRSADYPRHHARLLFLATALSYWRDNLKEGLAYALLGQEIARTTGSKFEWAGILYYLSDIHREMGEFQTALESIETSIAFYTEMENPARLSLALTSRGIILYRMGERMPAQASIEESLKIAVEAHNLWAQSYALRVQADMLRFDGDYPASYQAYERALVVSVEIDDRISIGMELANLSLLANVLGDYFASTHYAKRALSLFQTIGNEYQQPFPMRMLAYAALHEGDPVAARTYCMASLKGNHAIGHETGMIACLICLASIMNAEGNIPDAHDLLNIVLNEMERHSISLMEPDAKVLAALQLDLKIEKIMEHNSVPDLAYVLNKFGIV
jgi:predicted ATPase